MHIPVYIYIIYIYIIISVLVYTICVQVNWITTVIAAVMSKLKLLVTILTMMDQCSVL